MAGSLKPARMTRCSLVAGFMRIWCHDNFRDGKPQRNRCGYAVTSARKINRSRAQSSAWVVIRKWLAPSTTEVRTFGKFLVKAPVIATTAGVANPPRTKNAGMFS